MATEMVPPQLNSLEFINPGLTLYCICFLTLQYIYLTYGTLGCPGPVSSFAGRFAVQVMKGPRNSRSCGSRWQMPPVAPRRRDWEKSCGSARYPGYPLGTLGIPRWSWNSARLFMSFWVLGISYGTAMVKYLKFMLMGLYHVIPQCKDSNPFRNQFEL